jgi:hypothetical protein
MIFMVLGWMCGGGLGATIGLWIGIIGLFFIVSIILGFFFGK